MKFRVDPRGVTLANPDVLNPAPSPNAPATYLLRIPVHFTQLLDDVLHQWGATLIKKLGAEYFLVKRRHGAVLDTLLTPRFIRWVLPLHHVWPCNPSKMEGFGEKAAQTLTTKFSDSGIQGVFVGVLDASSRDEFYKIQAKSLRGRVMQLFGDAAVGFAKVEDQDASKPSLFCLVGEQGLYCGVGSPRETNGFYPGGTKFISQKAPHMISRAGAKIAEALHYVRLVREVPRRAAHWLELGACPGGMTSELLERGYRVTAVDRAPLDPRLRGRDGLKFHKADVAEFVADVGTEFDALLCDMNGESSFALGEVVRLARLLRPGGLVVFTLKASGIESYKDYVDHLGSAVKQAKAGGLRLIANTHLTYNRHELTLFFER